MIGLAKSNINIYSLLFITLPIFNLLVFLNCASHNYNTRNNQSGSIYGKLICNNPTVSLDRIRIYIQGSTYFANPDSLGYFLISDMPIGKYTVIAEVNNTCRAIMNEVEVLKDSISIIGEFLLECHYVNERRWEGIKIKEVNLADRGKMKGRVVDVVTAEPLQNIYVSILGTSWGAVTDSFGMYEIKEILPGAYAVHAIALGYYDLIKNNIEVKVDQCTFLDFGLIQSTLENKQ